MKKSISIVMLMAVCITYAQKKANGTIFVEHPAITVVEAMTQAFVKGDTDKVSGYLADDFKSYNGTGTNKDDKGQDKDAFLKSSKSWKSDIDYLKISRSEGAYPDALEYNDEDNKDQVWVQTWEDVKGVHKKTGVKIDMPMHRLFIVDKNNKIKTIINYSSSSVGDEINESFSERKNGTIYNHHEYINNVRRMIHAFENGDLDKAYSFYDEKARFLDQNSPDRKIMSLADMKVNDKKFLDKFEINSIDVSGYPDYLHYELGNTKVVQSWWNYRLTRKSDKKKIVLPVFFIDDFNDDGKITFEHVYYSEKLLEQ